MASTINISLPEPLRAYVETQIAEGRAGSAEAYIGELIEHDLAKHDLELHLLRALAEEDKAVLVPDEVLENGELVDFVKTHRPIYTP